MHAVDMHLDHIHLEHVIHISVNYMVIHISVSYMVGLVYLKQADNTCRTGSAQAGVQ